MNFDISISLLLFISLGVRAFLFEIKFQYIREKLRSIHELFEIFLDCSFCNGFWTGFFGYVIVNGIDIILIPFAILVGSSSYYLTLFVKSLTQKN
ncbi:hypothetical protein PDN41_05310 [Bacillus cereus]|nr:hypothetical protein [Bacillus cereus]